jgi:hypothetical protein
MSALQRLRRLIDVADPDGTVTVRWLAEVVGEDGRSPTKAGDVDDMSLERYALR